MPWEIKKTMNKKVNGKLKRNVEMLFAGLDVSSARIALCVMNEAGELVCQASIESEPGVIAEELRPWRDQLSLVGLEAGPTSAGSRVSCGRWICRSPSLMPPMHRRR